MTEATTPDLVPYEAPVPHYRFVTEWEDLAAGSTFTVKSERGAVYFFRAFVVNTRTGAEWVEAWGGKPGHNRFRAFPPDKVRPKRVKPKKQVTTKGWLKGKIATKPVPAGTITEHPTDWGPPSESTYRRGCRCPECREVKRAINARYREQRAKRERESS